MPKCGTTYPGGPQNPGVAHPAGCVGKFTGELKTAFPGGMKYPHELRLPPGHRVVALPKASILWGVVSPLAVAPALNQLFPDAL